MPSDLASSSAPPCLPAGILAFAAISVAVLVVPSIAHRAASVFPGSLTLSRINIPAIDWAVDSGLLPCHIALACLSCVCLPRCLTLDSGVLHYGCDLD